MISVLIRTFNSAKTLPKVMARLALSPGDEIIVVDSGSTDATLQIAQGSGARIVPAPSPFNYSKSLNLGFQAAKNPWVLVLSSHATPQNPNFLELYRAEITHLPGNVAVIYGPSTITGKSGLSEAENKISFHSKDNFQKIIHLCGNGNAFYRKAVWETLRFDENIRTAEDKIWLLTALDHGYDFAFLPEACTLNQNQASLRYMYRKGYGDAKAAPRSASHRPMGLYQLGGALKNQTLPRLRGEIDHGNWLRYSAHILGQFFGSRGEQNNHPGYLSK
ncbi:MAG: glycosyltransferase family 2 protein [Chthoniobacterales bacterium]